MEKAKVVVSKTEREVLTEATRGSIVPTKSKVAEFKSLLSKKLIEGRGNNKYTATKLGVYVVTETEGAEMPTNGNGSKEKAENTAKPQAKKRPSFLDKPKATLAELDLKYSKKYAHYVKGSVKEQKGGGKRIAQIRCTAKGCKDTRQVFTSDIFQVKLCEDCRTETKKKAA